MSGKQLRVIQWATGNCGERAMREVIRDPRMELVGVLTYNPKKHGVDAGQLCGEPPTGITATTDRDAILKLKADCVSYMPRATGIGITRAGLSIQQVLDDAIALTGSGKNIVTTCTDFFDGGHERLGDGRDRLLEACKRGGATIYASGGDPGFVTEMLPLGFLSNMRRIDHIEIEEFGDLSRRPSPHMVMEQMRFGKPLADYDVDRRKNHLYGEYLPTVRTLAGVAGLHIDEWVGEGGVAAARVDTQIVAGMIKAGTAAAQRIVIYGRSKGVERIRFIQYGYVTRDTVPDWGMGPLGWRLKFKGDTPLVVEIPWPIPLDELASYVPSFNVNGLVNAIPYLSDARPGFVTAADLPHILPYGPRPAS
jgi:2,4-diaminopentanoate dehydrogenase